MKLKAAEAGEITDWMNMKSDSGTGAGRYGTKKVVSKEARRLKNKDAKAARKRNRKR